MGQKRLVKIVAAGVLGLVALMGLQVMVGMGATTMIRNLPIPAPLEARFEATRIKVEDLPLGWHKGGVQVEDVPGADARFFWFYGTSDPNKTWVNVSQTLVLYPDPEAAVSAYDGWVDKYLPPSHKDAWILPSELKFDGQADQMVVACLPGYINGIPQHACEAIGRYGNVVVILLGNVYDDRWLKMEDFQAVLEAMDRRIVATMEGAGS